MGGAVRTFLEARGETPVGLAFGTRNAEACRAWLAERGLTPAPLEKGIGRDVESGAFREWQRVPISLTETRGVLLFAIEHTTPDGILPTASLACDETAAVSALDHAVVRSPDPDATKALYGERLGLRLALDRTFPEWGMRLLIFRVGGVTLEIAAQAPRPQEGSPATPRVGDDNDRLWGLSWRVPNADAARERLAGAGFDVSDVRAGRKPGTRVLTVRDGTCSVPTLLIEPPSR